jgi:hypothetical protein
MKIYPNLFAYLNAIIHSPPSKIVENLDLSLKDRERFEQLHLNNLVTDAPQLKASQRPIIVLEEPIESLPYWFIPLTDGVYEIGFPYLQPNDLQHHNFELKCVLNLDISGKSYTLYVSDEVLDLETIQEEVEIQKWENRLGGRLDKTTAELIRLFIGMFAEILGRDGEVLLTELVDKLESVNIEDANLPIVISLDKKYQLHRKIEAIGDKLRHQLRRQAELMSVGKIQEMDSYCLRDYVRRPGLTAVEKAGSKQRLMGIQRYQDFNTPENKFLVYFSQILHLNCFQYERSGAVQFQAEIRKIRLVVDLFKQQPIVKTIQDRTYQFTQPNYVLQQNPIYRSFYQAYLEYLQKKYEKERLWTFRNALLADTVYMFLTAALLKFQGMHVNANSAITGNLTPDQGRYIKREQNVKVSIFLQNQVYVFNLQKLPKTIDISENEPETLVQQDADINCRRYLLISDWVLTLEIHQLNSMELKVENLVFPIWVFWYHPDDESIMQMQQYFHKGIVFYLQHQGQEFRSEGLHLVKLPENFTEQGFSGAVDLMADLIKRCVESAV